MAPSPDRAPVTSIELRPSSTAILRVEEWESRAAHTSENLEREGFPLTEMAQVLGGFRFLDAADVLCCYDGARWWAWRDPAWVEEQPRGPLRMQPFTMDVAPMPAPPARRVDRRAAAVREKVEVGARSLIVVSDPFASGVWLRAALGIAPHIEPTADAIATDHELAASGDLRVVRTPVGMTVTRTLVEPIDVDAEVVEFAKSALDLGDRLWGDSVPEPEEETPS
jgi:hypothetical protein